MDFFDKTCKEMSKTEENYRQILHIRNSLGIKFQVKLTILNYWTKLTQKGYFQFKKE